MIATASAAATPARADMITPSPPSGLSPNSPVPAPNARRKEDTESPGSSAAWAALVRIGEVIFIASSRGCLIAGSRPEPSEFSIVGRQALSGGSKGSGGGSSKLGQLDLSGEGPLVIARGLAQVPGRFLCRYKWFCCRSSFWLGSPSS